MSGKRCGILLLAGAMGACSPTVEDMGSVFVTPGKYDLLKCPDLAKQSIAAAKREKELVSLMDRANQDGAGPVVNTFVYSSDLATVRAQLALLRKTAAEKNCDNLVTQLEQSKPVDQPKPKPPPTSNLPALH